MARGYNAEVTNVKVLEEGVCHVVQGRLIGHRAARAHRVVAASVMLLAAIVVCVALAGSAPGSKVTCSLCCACRLGVSAGSAGDFFVRAMSTAPFLPAPLPSVALT